MKIYLSILLLAIAILFNITLINPSLADETSTGSEIFQANCASCHRGGANILIEQKTLEKPALSKYLENYDTDPIKAIINQIQNGKNAMPAFKNKLSDQDILDIAAYVFQKAETGW
ncbi:c-type cytochrome [Okeanomitos corallinicola TIOX110]|uniref:C-type cytochrome n=1 Tax=Okeanomitos corallinicola TIOX110 TaxID=3133117 RepID=A0ABZ2ULB5_9CYAN